MNLATITRGSRRGTATLADQLRDQSLPLAAVLNSLHANCFVADLQLTLVWNNRRAAETLRGLSPAIRSAFGLDIGQVLGGSIHRFHQDPAAIERILADPKALPRESVFSFGGATLRTLINSITDASGTTLGYVVIWDNVSERNSKADAAVREVTAATQTIGQVSREVGEIAGRTSAEAENAAGATEELRSAVAEIARSSNEATAQVNAAVEATHTGVARLADLQRASTEIGEFLQLIVGVAEQTKLLALNATIEAARAGEAGKGFAVVADEVKQLAGTTAASTADIEARIHAIQTAATAGSQALAEIEQLIAGINDSQTSVSAAIEQQSAVAGELARGISAMAEGAQTAAKKVSQSIAGIDEVTARTTALHRLLMQS